MSIRYFGECLIRGKKDESIYTLDMFENDIRGLYRNNATEPTHHNDIDFLFHLVCDTLKVDKSAVKEKPKRSKGIYSLARGMFSKLIVNDYKLFSQGQAGKYLGNRDRTTIHFAIASFNNIFDTEKEMRDKYWVVKSKFDNYLNNKNALCEQHTLHTQA